MAHLHRMYSTSTSNNLKPANKLIMVVCRKLYKIITGVSMILEFHIMISYS